MWRRGRRARPWVRLEVSEPPEHPASPLGFPQVRPVCSPPLPSEGEQHSWERHSRQQAPASPSRPKLPRTSSRAADERSCQKAIGERPEMGPLHRLRRCLSHLYGLTSLSGAVGTGCCVSHTATPRHTAVLPAKSIIHSSPAPAVPCGAADFIPLRLFVAGKLTGSPSSRPPAAGRAQKGTDPCLFSSEPLLNLY